MSDLSSFFISWTNFAPENHVEITIAVPGDQLDSTNNPSIEILGIVYLTRRSKFRLRLSRLTCLRMLLDPQNSLTLQY